MPIENAAQSKPRRPGEFTFVTKAIDTYEDDGRRRWKAIASSTVADRAGDEISLTALDQMALKLKSGVNIFMNHSHLVPEDLFGVSDNAEIKNSGMTDKGGYPIYDLYASGWVNDSNPRAVQLADALDRGVRFGASIGAVVKSHARKKEGGMKIDGLDLVEASIVGIPMNQRTWTQKAANALAGLEDEPEEETIGDEIAKAVDESIVEAKAEEVAAVEAEAAEETHSTEKADTCPTCGGSRGADGDCTDDYHSNSKSASADSITSDVTTGGQDALEATPETAPAADEDSVTDPAEMQKALTVSADDMAALLKGIEGLVSALAKSEAEKNEKDAALKTAQEEIDSAKDVIERVMKTPLTRKATGQIDDFVGRFPQYDPRIEKYLNRS